METVRNFTEREEERFGRDAVLVGVGQTLSDAPPALLVHFETSGRCIRCVSITSNGANRGPPVMLKGVVAVAEGDMTVERLIEKAECLYRVHCPDDRSDLKTSLAFHPIQ